MKEPLVFQDLEVVEFCTELIGETETSESSAQTDSIKLSEATSFCPNRADKSVQSSPPPRVNDLKDVNLAKLSFFLKRSSNVMIEEIKESVTFSRQLDPFLKHLKGSASSYLKVGRKFESKYLATILQETESQMHDSYVVSGVAWNRSQTSLAIAYKMKKHTDWCIHKNFVLIWNLYQIHVEDEKPSYVVQVDGCVTCIHSNPFHSSIYALGLHSGRIIIIDTRILDSDLTINDELVVSSSLNTNLPKESIVGIEWLQKKSETEYFLISFSQDGLIIKWQFEARKEDLKVIEVFTILLSDLPKSMGIKNSTNELQSVAIRSFAFEPTDLNNFIVGCEGGAVFHCSLESPIRDRDKSSRAKLMEVSIMAKNPVVMSYAPHRASVTCVKFSKTLHNSFLTTAIDQELRIWKLFQSKPLVVRHSDTNILAEIWLNNSNFTIGIQEDGSLCVHDAKEKFKLVNRFSLENRKSAIQLWSNDFDDFDEIAIVCSENIVYVHQVEIVGSG